VFGALKAETVKAMQQKPKKKAITPFTS